MHHELPPSPPPHPPQTIIVKAAVDSTSRSAFQGGFAATLGVLAALFVVFVVVPLIIVIGCRIMSAGMQSAERMRHEKADRQRAREIQALELEASRAAQREREARARAEEIARQSRAKKAQPRKWHDQNGIFLFEGTCLHCDETTVTIKLETGELADVSLDALSGKDQEYARHILYGEDP